MQPRWWASIDLDDYWFGVFQGGGAKGAAYAGPLKTFAERGQWFRHVAGASAGALTAGLVAAGFHPDELTEMTVPMLETVTPASRADKLLSGWSGTRWLVRYDSAGLEDELESRLREGVSRHGGDSHIPVTFRGLADATGIELTVVAVDANSGQPLPFSTQWSPDVPVAPAIIASCAIPVVFPSVFIEVSDYSTVLTPWRRLCDGGTFANFPGFVFTEQAFRDFYDLGPPPRPARTVGFVFGWPAALFPPRPERFVEDPHRTNVGGAVRAAESPGRLERAADDWYSAELAMTMATEAASGSQVPANVRLGLERLKREAHRKPYLRSVTRHLTDVSWPVLSVALVAVPGLLLVLLFTVGINNAISGHTAWNIVGGIALAVLSLVLLSGLMALRRFLSLVVIEGRGVLRTWTGRALRPPIWTGATQGSLVVFVEAPGLQTTSFRCSPEAVAAAVWVAEVLSRKEIDAILAGETAWSKSATAARKTVSAFAATDHRSRVPTRRQG